MGSRITKKDLALALHALCESDGVPWVCIYGPDGEISPHLAYGDRVGMLMIDHNPTYGGAIVMRYSNESGGQTYVYELGSARRPPRELYEMIAAMKNMAGVISNMRARS